MSLNLGFTIFDGARGGFFSLFSGALLSGFISSHNFLTLLFGGGGGGGGAVATFGSSGLVRNF